MFSCDENKCISPALICNGINDCDDGSDEHTNCAGSSLMKICLIYILWFTYYDQWLHDSIAPNVF